MSIQKGSSSSSLRRQIARSFYFYTARIPLHVPRSICQAVTIYSQRPSRYFVSPNSPSLNGENDKSSGGCAFCDTRPDAIIRSGGRRMELETTRIFRQTDSIAGYDGGLRYLKNLWSCSSGRQVLTLKRKRCLVRSAVNMVGMLCDCEKDGRYDGYR